VADGVGVGVGVGLAAGVGVGVGVAVGLAVWRGVEDGVMPVCSGQQAENSELLSGSEAAITRKTSPARATLKVRSKFGR
jgi:hypothetical protein